MLNTQFLEESTHFRRDSLTVTCKPYCYCRFLSIKKSIAYIVGTFWWVLLTF
uniref:Uncharacterized protein n=1 Tax=Anguilla anguilla TaxID=7936 RepID=A0A0E9QVJ8_ANGAN